MDIAVLGITPAGCTIAGLLHEAGEDVTIVGPPGKAARISQAGLTVRQAWDGKVVTSRVRAAPALSHTPDLLIFATRTQDTHQAAALAMPFGADATIATIQQGTKLEQIVARTLPRDNIVTCVLTMGAACREAGDVTLNFKGHMVIGRAYEAAAWREDLVLRAMSGAFEAVKGAKIAHYNCTRLLLNLPYCIPAIIGESVQSAFMDPGAARAAVLLLKEGVKVTEEAGVHIEPLPDFDEGSLKSLLAAPLDEAARRFSEMVLGMSRLPCHGPVLGSIEQGEPTEIDYINGELVKIAGVLGCPAPLNSLMVRLVHEVEETGRFMGLEGFTKAIG